MNPEQRRYQIDGQQESSTMQHSSTSATSSLPSLPFKSEKGYPPQTPSRTDGSDEITVTTVPETVPKTSCAQSDKQPEEANSSVATSDALDEAIAEARAIEHLVS